jgi:hypothetical protein
MRKIVIALFIVAILAAGAFVIVRLADNAAREKAYESVSTNILEYAGVENNIDDIALLYKICNEATYQDALKNVNCIDTFRNQFFRSDTYTGVVRYADVPKITIKEKGYMLTNNSEYTKVFIRFSCEYADNRLEEDVVYFADYTKDGRLMSYYRSDFRE